MQYPEDDFWQITPPMRRFLVMRIRSIDLEIRP